MSRNEKTGYLVVALLIACNGVIAQQVRSLAARYRPEQVLQGNAEMFRQNATQSPLPNYPLPTREAGRQGLVVVELAVSPAGQVVDSNVLESFDSNASTAVVDTLKQWRFYSAKDLEARGRGLPCTDCVRINRLAFDFLIDHGRAHVVDLAAAEIRRTHFPNSFGPTKGTGNQNR